MTKDWYKTPSFFKKLLKTGTNWYKTIFFKSGPLISGGCEIMAETARFELAVSQNGTTP